ncbi:MAG TPA: hypothetical protein VFQ31_05740 [Methyloceanibacter sp.]|nr:hypothetical protein [Methyloceanibacter sp.]
MTDEVGGPSIQARPDARPVPLVVWAARLSVYFLLQGAFLLLAYAYYGFDTDPQSFPPGQRLDPQHAAVHLLWGIAGTYVGFVRPHLATPFMLAFAAFYTLLAVLGTFTSQHLGMHLDTPVNLTARLFASPLTGLGLGLILVARAKDWRAVLVPALADARPRRFRAAKRRRMANGSNAAIAAADRACPYDFQAVGVRWSTARLAALSRGRQPPRVSVCPTDPISAAEGPAVPNRPGWYESESIHLKRMTRREPPQGR